MLSLSLSAHALSYIGYVNHTYHIVKTFISVFQTAGGSSLAVILALFFGPSLQNTVSFYVVVLGVAGAVATPILILALDKHFILWIMDFVTKDHTRVRILIILLIECAEFNDVRQIFYQVPSLQDLFKTVKAEVILSFLL